MVGIMVPIGFLDDVGFDSDIDEKINMAIVVKHVLFLFYVFGGVVLVFTY